MKIKKIMLLICVSLMIISIYSCRENIIDTKNEAEENISNGNTTSEENEFKYKVPNTSINFSKNDLIYFIMIDRFNDGDTLNNLFDDTDTSKDNPKSYQGGDITGIIEKLPYIKSLGATAIWITPIVKNEPYGYHGYWTEDFYEVDPHFGDLETLRELVDEAHNLDIKVIIDYVVNHTGYNHPWIDEDDKYNWFHHNGMITNFRDQEQVENYSLAGLPDLNQDNPEVKAYFFENALWWIKETGIDGMRLDTVRHVPKEFWNEFAYYIKYEYPDFYLLGEVWVNSTTFLESYHELGIDGLANFPLYEGIKSTFQVYGKATDLKIAIINDEKFSKPELSGVFLDNHDTSRLISNTSKYNEEYLKLGLSFIMTYPSIPIIYYGTEIGLEGKSDPDNRKFMNWDEIENPQNKIFPFFMDLVDLRAKINSLKLDTFNLLTTTTNYISYEQVSDNDSVVVVLNVSDKMQKVILESLSFEGTYINYLTGEIYNLKRDEEFDVDPFTSIVLIKESR